MHLFIVHEITIVLNFSTQFYKFNRREAWKKSFSKKKKKNLRLSEFYYAFNYENNISHNFPRVMKLKTFSALAWTVCMYVCMKSVFILAYLATICWLMWIIQSPTSSLFPAPCLVLERDLSCSTSLSYRPVSSFIQLYLYRLLAATNSGSVLPFDYTWILLSQTEPT